MNDGTGATHRVEIAAQLTGAPAVADRTRANQSWLVCVPRLIAACVAVILIGMLLVVGERYAERIETRYIHALAPKQFLLKNQGSALQQTAFRQSDLLPLYGSSELQTLEDPYHASNIFQAYPTGFTVFTVGDVGTTTLLMVQRLAAIGLDLRGKKVAFSLSPYWYYQIHEYSAEYAGNFSPLHAGELLFGTNLSADLKVRVAKRMLQYPGTLEGRPFLKLAAEKVADDSLLGRLIYGVVWPLGRLQNWVLRLQDHWETLAYIREQRLDPSPRRRPAHMDWRSLQIRAEREFGKHNNNNPFGFDNRWYERKFERTLQKNTITNATFHTGLEASAEWTDLELLLRVAKELGAQPLVLCAPSPGLYYDYLGITDELRQAYYRRFEQVVKSYGVPVVNFADHDRDGYFILDPAAHLSEKGWAYFDEMLNAFYHGELQ